MKWINQKRVELQSIIDNINGCYTTKNRNGFTIKSKNGVVWGETKRKRKWGQVFEEDNRFSAVIDFPTGSYKLTELIQRVNLDERDEGEQVSGIRLRKDTPYDSVQIAVYEDSSTTYSFNNKSFINFINEVAYKVMK